MKIAAVQGEQQAEIIEVPIPEPKENWVLVKIYAAPMCTEYKAWLAGRHEPLGHEAAGEVVAVGAVRSGKGGRPRSGDAPTLVR